MARRVADKNLDTRAARRKLAPRAEPYWRSIERGLHLGYRRHADMAGPWIVRHYVGDQRYEEAAIGVADDLSDADGVAILTYWQAVDKARARMKDRALTDAGVPFGPYTVAAAIADHLHISNTKRKARSKRAIAPKLTFSPRLARSSLASSPQRGSKIGATHLLDSLREYERSVAKNNSVVISTTATMKPYDAVARLQTAALRS